MSSAYLTSNSESTRVVFLIDVAMGRMLDICQRKTLGRAITLTSIRTLLFLSKFPHSKYKDVLKWNYTFYDSQQTDWSLRIKSGNFLELSTHHVESYSRDVLTRLDSSAVKCVQATQASATLLYNAIGTAIQDYPWDAPFIISPIRPNKSSQKCSRRLSSVEKEQSNILLVFNYCPTSKEDLQRFCCVKHPGTDVNVDIIKSRLFTEDLCSSVMKKNVKISFINCTDLAKESKSKDLDGLLLYSEAVNKSIGGKVLELSQFISPVCHRVLHQCFSSHGELQRQNISTTDQCSHSSINEKKSFCSLTYPMQTVLSTVTSQADTTDSACREPNLLKLSSKDDTSLCILSVSSMLQDGSPLEDFGHYPSTDQSSPIEGVVIGVIKTVDISFSWLHPTKLYTCISVSPGTNEKDYYRYFQGLNLWLATNKCALMVKMAGADACALLQPITSLVSSFMFVKPEYITAVYALPSTSLADNGLFQTDHDAPCCSKQFYTDDNLFPLEADFCVNLDQLFSTFSAMPNGRSQSLIVQSFHPCSLPLPPDNILSSDFYTNLYQSAKTEESNYSNSLRTFQETLLYKINQEPKSEVEHQQATEPSKDHEPGALSQDEAMNHFILLYQQCVQSNKNEEELFQSLTEAVKKLEDILTSDELLQFLDQNMLLSHSELRAKQEVTQNDNTEKRKINEYQLQTLLYLEAHKRGLQDHVTVAEQLVLLLRGISLMTDTKFLSRYLTEIILANYLESCSDAIRLLHEELMLPLPVQLSSPTLDTSYATSDGESPFSSINKPLVTASTVEDNSSCRKLKRFKSFHGFPAAKKLITVPVEKKPKKGNRYNSKSRSTFRSVRSPFKSPLQDRIGGKNVRRSLFARSKSMVTISHLPRPADSNVHSISNPQDTSHHGIKVDNIVCVQETPLKKQVPNYQQFKLQRTRSKLGKASYPEVNTIEESPCRELQSISGSSFPPDGNGGESEAISSASSDEDPSEIPDTLMSLYLSPPAATTQENETPTDSMLAFKFSTPPKEARLNFANVTTSLE